MRSYTKRALAQFSLISTTIVESNGEKFAISENLFAVQKVLRKIRPYCVLLLIRLVLKLIK